MSYCFRRKDGVNRNSAPKPAVHKPRLPSITQIFKWCNSRHQMDTGVQLPPIYSELNNTLFYGDTESFPYLDLSTFDFPINDQAYLESSSNYVTYLPSAEVLTAPTPAPILDNTIPLQYPVIEPENTHLRRHATSATRSTAGEPATRPPQWNHPPPSSSLGLSASQNSDGTYEAERVARGMRIPMNSGAGGPVTRTFPSEPSTTTTNSTFSVMEPKAEGGFEISVPGKPSKPAPKKKAPKLKVPKVHKRVVGDPGERKFLCHFKGCPKGIVGNGFTRPSSLLTHHRVHTKETPFVCNTCTKAFGVKSNMGRHSRNLKACEKHLAALAAAALGASSTIASPPFETPPLVSSGPEPDVEPDTEMDSPETSYETSCDGPYLETVMEEEIEIDEV